MPSSAAEPGVVRLQERSCSDLHLAFLGCGSIAMQHARRLRTMGGVRCSFASRDGERAAEFRQRLGGNKSYAGYEGALLDEGVDAVVITTPTAQHLPLTLAALEAGKHVIVEKPAFLRSTDVDVVEAAAAGSGRKVFIAENYAYKPLRRVLSELIRTGAIGEVRYLAVNALKLQHPGGWRDDGSLAGGGALFEGGIHWLHLMASVGLTVESVHGFRPDGSTGIERSMLVVVQYEEGAVGTLHHAWDTGSLCRGLRLSRIYGTHGSITFESNGLFVLVRTRGVRWIVPGLRDIAGYRAMFADFLASLRDNRESKMTLAHARRDLELVEAAYQSAP
ncbi:MAG: Gfo/Idh/MocA family oxidoreductase [Gemmatimonadales bacterium]|nr:Gfo/Idh/MocA family oxidoreductase [Gemmatimonadales bacterium]